VRAVHEHAERLRWLEQERHEQGNAWRLHPVVEALQALRGVQFTVAVPTVAERGDRTRFDPPRALMKCLGRMPSEYSTGERRRQGAITKAGNTHARRALVEGAWAYRYTAKVSRHLQLRLAKPPKAIQDISWQAQVRLCQRYRKLMARGKHANQVVVAVARELVGCMWPLRNRSPSPRHRIGLWMAPVPIIEQGSDVHRKRGSPGVVESSLALRGCQKPSSLDRGRHPTDTRKVVANPRISA
jgi:hypothetical protein